VNLYANRIDLQQARRL